MGKRAQQKKERRLELEGKHREALQQRRREKQARFRFWRRADFWIYLFSLVLIASYPFLKPQLQKIKSVAQNQPKAVLAEKALIVTSLGEIEVKFFATEAPKTVENFVTLAQRGYYNNLTWHRVIKDFMIQGGDPKGDGSGGVSAFGAPFADEINSHKIVAGALAMANSGPNTNGSQFFIVTEREQPHLDGKHTVFGEVTSGMEVVRAIAAVEVDENDKPKEPVLIREIRVKN